MHVFVFDESVDFGEFLLCEGPQLYARRRGRASSVHNDSSSGHSCPGVVSDITMDDDESSGHSSTNTGASGTSDDDMAAAHFRTCIIAASVQHGDGTGLHHETGKMSRHALTNDGCPLISGAKKTSCIPLQRKRTTFSECGNPGTKHAEGSQTGAFGKRRTKSEFTVFWYRVTSVCPSDTENCILFRSSNQSWAQFFVDVHRAYDDLGNIRHGPWSCLPHK